MAEDAVFPRILMVAPQPFFEPRGMCFSVYLRCRALAESGCRTDLVTYPYGEDRVPPGTRHHTSPGLPGVKRVPAGPSVRKLLLDLLMFVYLFVRLIRGRKRYDWLHCHEEAAYFCRPLSALFSLPLLYDHHSSLAEITRDSPYGLSIPVRLLGRLERRALAGCDAVICVIPALEEEIRAAVDHDRVFPIPDSAPEETLPDEPAGRPVPEELESWRDPDRTMLVYTGSLAEYQTMDAFLRGMAEAGNRNQLQFLLVGGTGSRLREIRRLLEQLGLVDLVRSVGRVPHASVVDHLQLGDVLVSPRAESRNTPLKIYTYMWTGKPLLVSDVTAHRAVLDDDDALWARPSAEGYRRALERLQETDLTALARRTRHIYEERFGWARFQQRHRAMVKTLCDAWEIRFVPELDLPGDP